MVAGADADRKTSGAFHRGGGFCPAGTKPAQGCLSVSNKEEVLHLFVEAGFVVYATGEKGQGEFALSRAVKLQDATYEWFQDAKPPGTNLRQNIAEYASRHSMARDMQAAQAVHPQKQYVAMPKALDGQGRGEADVQLCSASPTVSPRWS